MADGSTQVGHDYFTGDTLSKFSGAVLISLLFTTIIIMIFETNALITGFSVALLVSAMKWLQDVEKGRIKINPDFSKIRRTAKRINILIMVIINGVLIFFSASGTGSFFYDRLAKPGTTEEQSTIVQSLFPWTGTAQTESHIDNLRQDSLILSNILSDNITEIRNNLTATRADLVEAQEEISILRQSDEGPFLERIKVLEIQNAESMAIAQTLEGEVAIKSALIETQQMEIETLEQQYSDELNSAAQIQAQFTAVRDERDDLQRTLESYAINVQEVHDILIEDGYSLTPELLQLFEKQ